MLGTWNNLENKSYNKKLLNIIHKSLKNYTTIKNQFEKDNYQKKIEKRIRQKYKRESGSVSTSHYASDFADSYW